MFISKNEFHNYDKNLLRGYLIWISSIRKRLFCAVLSESVFNELCCCGVLTDRHNSGEECVRVVGAISCILATHSAAMPCVASDTPSEQFIQVCRASSSSLCASECFVLLLMAAGDSVTGGFVQRTVEYLLLVVVLNSEILQLLKFR